MSMILSCLYSKIMYINFVLINWLDRSGKRIVGEAPRKSHRKD